MSDTRRSFGLICSRPRKRSAAKACANKIQEAYNAVRRRDGEALAPSTRRYIHVILKSALARAVEQSVIARNPADAFTSGFRGSNERK